jgi:hypothetical protein
MGFPLGCAGELSVDALRCLNIGAVCLLGGLKGSKVDLPAVLSDFGNPRGNLAVRIEVDALETRGVVHPASLVGLVLGHRALAQVGNRVIERGTVNVIDGPAGPLTVDVEPCKPVSFVCTPINLDLDTSAKIDGPGDLSGDLSPRSGIPCKDPGSWVVMKQLFKTFGSQTHSVAPDKSVERPVYGRLGKPQWVC